MMEVNEHEAMAAWAVSFAVAVIAICLAAAQWAPYNNPPPCECDTESEASDD